MRPYLEDLIARLADQTPTPSSSSSVSWLAHREAEALTDGTMVGELAASVQAERSKHRRMSCYFVIGKIGHNLRDPEAAVVLLSLLESERDKYNLATLLECVGEIPKAAECDLSRVYGLLQDKRWLVRHAAIRALNNSTSPEAEQRLLHHLAETTDPDDQIYCHAVLNRIGTRRAIGPIELNLKSRKRDVKLSAQSALAAIRARHA